MEKSIASFLLAIVFFSSCEKKEEPVKLPPHGLSMVTTIEMKDDYSQQVCFNLQTGAKFTSATYGWDLAFDNRNGSNLILMNTGKDVKAWVSNDTTFNAITSPNGIAFDWDRSGAEYDSLIIKDRWLSSGQCNNKIILLDLSNLEPADIRYKKIQVTSVNAMHYTLRLANINGSDEQMVTITKQAGDNFTYFSFNPQPQQKACEPASQSWQLMFTRYKTWVSALGTTIPYNVTGVWLNPEGVSCTKLVDIPFELITYESVKNLPLQNNRDAVGYEWKGFDFDFTNGNYKIFSNWTYIIKDANGTYFKMRFLDFYDANHHKGFPKIEYQKL